MMVGAKRASALKALRRAGHPALVFVELFREKALGFQEAAHTYVAGALGVPVRPPFRGRTAASIAALASATYRPGRTLD